jgi:membrane protein
LEEHFVEAARVCGLESTEDTRMEFRRLRTIGWREIRYLLLRLVDDWYRHRVPRLGASLAFYTMLSMAPLLIVVLAVAGFVFGREAAAGQLVWQIRELVGLEGARVIQDLLKGAADPLAGGIATAVGLITLFFGASSVVAELRDALNTIWDVPTKETEFGLRSILAVLRERLASFAVVLAFGFLLLVSLAVNAAISAMGQYFSYWLPTSEWLLQIANSVISFLVIAILFAAMFRYLPDIHVTWGDVALGAFGTAVLFTAGKTLIGIYLGKASIGSTYGAAGSLVIMLVWVYYSAQIFFLGAEFTQAYATCFGSRPREGHARETELRQTIAPPEREVKLELPDDIRPVSKLEV